MPHFHSAFYFWLFLPLALVALLIFYKRKTRRPFLRFTSLQAIKQIRTPLRARFKHTCTVLKACALILVIVGLARPQKIDAKIKRNIEGVDIILLVDLSLTMQIEDMDPLSRLEAAKQAQIDFVKNRPNDKIGVVAFSGEAYTAVPPTLDHKIVIESLKALNYSDTIKMGTAQGVAIALGAVRLKDSKAKSRIMVFITDGENNTGTIDPDTALKLAKDLGIKIYTVGVGSDGPKQLPVFSKDMFGRTVKRYQPMTTTFHEGAMIKIAEETGGKYWRSRSNRELLEVYDTIDRLEKTKIESNHYTKYSEEFFLYVQWALALYLLSAVLNLTLLRRAPA